MLKLSQDFYITSSKDRSYWNDTKLDRDYEYDFRYKEFKVELKINFKIVGYTYEDNMAIINFGYDVDVEKWSDREQGFSYIEGLDSQNGKSTKKYFNSQEARELLLRFIERKIDTYLKTVSPAIIIRGALSDIQVNLTRYKRLDAQFFKYGYHKKEFDIKNSDSLYQISSGKKEEDDKVIWVYCKNESHFKKLENVFK